MRISESMVDITYGKALFKVAIGSEKENEILEEMNFLDDMFKKQSEYFSFLSRPDIEKTLKKQLVRELLEGKVEKECLNFILILIDKRRFARFSGIIAQFNKNICEARNVLDGTIVSAVPLEEDQLKSMEEQVSKLMRKNITLVNKIDKDILGGVKIFVEEKVIDATVKTRLKNMKEKISQG